MQIKNNYHQKILTSYWSFDNCIRSLESGEKYYFGNTVYMH